MVTKYPAQIDNSITLPSAIDNFTPVTGSVVNRLRDAIISIESELGVKPSGANGTVRARIDAISTSVDNLNIINLAGDLGGTLISPKVTGLQGHPISTATPSTNDGLIWNGIAWVPGAVGSTTSAPVTQETWFIDPISGSDTNTGLTSGTALKTLAEMYARWGPIPRFVASVSGFITVTLLSAPGRNDPIILTGDLGSDTNLLYKGTVSTVRSGTFSAVTVLNEATNQAWEVDDSARDWSPDLGRRIRNTTVGTNLNQIAWVAKSIAATSARISQPALLDPVTVHGYTGPTVGSFSLSDTYVVEDITEAYLANVIRVGRFEGNELVHPGRVFFQDIYFKSSIGATLIQQCASIVFIGCRFDNSYVAHALQPSFINCNLGNGIGVFEAEASIIAGLISGDINVSSGSRIYPSEWLIQGATIYLFGGEVVLSGKLGIFDSLYDAINVGYGSYGKGFFDAGYALFGSGNGGYGVNIAPLGFMAYAVTPTLTGTSGNVSVNGVVSAWAAAPKILSSVGGGVTLGGLDTYVQFNDAGTLGGDAGLTYNKTTNVLSLSDALAIGAIPSTTGAIRLATSSSVRSRGVLDTLDLVILETNASDVLHIGTDPAFTAANQVSGMSIYTSPAGTLYMGNGGTTRLRLDTAGVTIYTPGDPLTFGYTGAATTGLIRMPIEGMITSRNTAGTADNTLIGSTGAGDELAVWGTGGTYGHSRYYIGSGASMSMSTATVDTLILNATNATFGVPVVVTAAAGSISIGATPATTGDIRLSNVSAINFRDGTNTADLPIVTTTGSALLIGNQTSVASAQMYANAVGLWGTSSVGIYNTSGSGYAIFVEPTKTTLEITTTEQTGNVNGKVIDVIRNIRTTDATITDIYTWTIINNATTTIDIVINAITSDGVAGGVWKRSYTLRDNATVVTAIGTVHDTQTDEDAAAWDVTIDTDGAGTGRVRVTGAAVTNINWYGAIRLQSAYV